MMFQQIREDSYDRLYTDWQIVMRLGQYFKDHVARIWVIVIGGIATSTALAVIPILIADGVGLLESGAPDRDLALLIGALFLMAIIRYVANWASRRQISQAVGHITAAMRSDALESALRRDMAFYDENKSGKVLSRITSDTEDFAQVLMQATDIVSQLIQAVILVAVLFSQSFLLTVIMLIFIPPFIWLALIFSNLARNATRQGARVMALVNDNIQESVTGITVAKNFRQEAAIYNAFLDVNKQSYSINLRRGFVIALVFPILNAVSGFAIAAILYLGAVYTLRDTIVVSIWFLYMQAIDRFWFPFINITAYWSQFQGAMSALERVFALIDAENKVLQIDNRQVGKLRGHIQFKDVWFEYKPAQPVLRGFDLEIAPGETVAFVGHTGAGKSTIAKLVTRFYEFQRGELLIDGQDIRTFDMVSYRKQLGLVPQTPFLFNGSILENIRYGNPGASDSEIEAIAHSVGGGEWLETIPEGLQADVGERGAHLSMGQRQLVALMRVLVQKPAIFILDEATASIDPFTELQIQEALDLILRRSTSILIAHRLSTVRSADRIVVLREGAIIEEGSHDSLIQQGGHYAELYNTYFRHQSLSYIENARQMLVGKGAS